MSVAVLKTPLCPWCNKHGMIEIDRNQYNAWKYGGVLIQNAFPQLDKALREQIKTGYHPECWDEMFMDIHDNQKEG